MFRRHPINYNQRIGAILAGRSGSPDTDSGIDTWLSVNGGNLKTWHQAFECSGDGRVGLDADRFCLNGGHRTGKVTFLGKAVADHHYFIQTLYILRQYHINGTASIDRYFLGDIT